MATWTQEDAPVLSPVNARRPLFPLFLLALTTGMRRGELVGLRWSDVDLDRQRLSVQQQLVAVEYELQFTEPKTERSRRSVALDPGTVSALRAHRTRQAQEKLLLGGEYDAGHLVFSSERGRPLHPMSLSEAFQRRARAAGLPAIRFHDLRHTYASLALAEGVHPKIVSDRLGHSSITVTIDTYSHALPALAEAAASSVADLIL